ncbi:cyclic lactone autoinducer peptide [Erysipelothrix rhusiopathiae]|nr:cyclic lactone autoinducer peptide [Erysipelothrix rhusiopathiae]UPU40008.1 cyclic lactone autoinducer peptide [Erysipelothrix sp. Poltava]AGN25270.1 hypothetical protein K210_08535 [Erysipelothrix rhusiopathiae SY1027]AWU40939.1 cyclic lactone autoinducer peptide [Erysipelothrix rhusiopathiae]AYV35135.1 cyclic lactone autoinducer peptide [Erysipelothrix rhusiopathiae]MCG4435845.1 cyclic lactone autoinducer peptide [Erysipelothrix rhusiopathiae]
MKKIVNHVVNGLLKISDQATTLSLWSFYKPELPKKK